MSWEAVTWASKQRMKLPHEQLILLVLANCADPEGVAFAQWRGREHWWTYLVDKTRLSKSSLFRHMNTMIDLGLCERTMIVLQDGARRPIIRLNLTMNFDIDEHEAGQSHGETGAEGDVVDAEIVSDDNTLEDAFGGSAGQSHHETGPTSGNGGARPIPTGGTEPFPIVGMQEDSKSDSKSKIPPNPPGGGLSAAEGFDEFAKVWGVIPKMAPAQAAWERTPSDQRPACIASARGYRAWVAAQSKRPAEVAAASFIRDVAGWAQWLPFVPKGDGARVSIAGAYPLESAEARAISMAYTIAGAGQALRGFMIRNGLLNYQRPITARLRALAEAPRDRDGWPILTRQQAAAWEGLMREAVTVQVRNHLREGARAPWPWPPSHDGTIYTTTTGSPQPAMTEQDAADFT
ncbi:hypothetical protein [Bradyrhizobium sp. SRS-191]|uniref:hypothetical protein n=1 Tax=Bradyrhizobium sp. SRS-191 TaxID=2962606 RepID=UPI00211E3900|nr:hypothetical protein [Bradyrhizobium sp. SRS-191]